MSTASDEKQELEQFIAKEAKRLGRSYDEVRAAIRLRGQSAFNIFEVVGNLLAGVDVIDDTWFEDL